MRIITVNLPKCYIDALDVMSDGPNSIYPSRSEAVRTAVKNLLMKDLALSSSAIGEFKSPKHPDNLPFRIVTVYLPECYIDALDIMSCGSTAIYPSRSAATRLAVRDLIMKDLAVSMTISKFLGINHPHNPPLITTNMNVIRSKIIPRLLPMREPVKAKVIEDKTNLLIPNGMEQGIVQYAKYKKVEKGDFHG